MSDARRAEIASLVNSPDECERAAGYGSFARLGRQAVACIQVRSVFGDLAAFSWCEESGLLPGLVAIGSEHQGIASVACQWRELLMHLEFADKPSRHSRPRKVAGARIAQAMVTYGHAAYLRRHREYCGTRCFECGRHSNGVAAGAAWVALHDAPLRVGFEHEERAARKLLTRAEDGSWRSLVDLCVRSNAALTKRYLHEAAYCGEAHVTIHSAELNARVLFNGKAIIQRLAKGRAEQVTRYLLS